MKRAFVVWRRIERRFSGISFKKPKLKKTMKRHFTSTLAATVPRARLAQAIAVLAVLALLLPRPAAAQELTNTVTLVTETTNWRESTNIDDTINADAVPWLGATFLPEASTFTIIPTEGAPYVNPVPGATALFSGSSVRFYRTTFDLPHFTTLALDVSASFDNDLHIFINGHDLALEGNFTMANFQGLNHRLFVNTDGSIINGYEGGQPFSTSVASNFPSSFFHRGSNEAVLALRNLNGGDSGGVAFRADLVMTGDTTNFPLILVLERFGSGIQLTFPTNYQGFRIESTTVPGATNWVTESTGTNRLVLPLSATNHFFRAAKP
jgi:hypothetical protein